MIKKLPLVYSLFSDRMTYQGANISTRIFAVAVRSKILRSTTTTSSKDEFQKLIITF